MTFAIDTGPSADFYDFDRVVTGILGMPRPVRSVFGPPELAQAPADLSTATVGLLVTSGAYYPDQPRMRETGDLSFRLLPRTRDLTDILSMVGSIHDYDRLATGTAPEIVAEFTAMGVDIVLVLPFCPQCHMAAGILARAIERRGLPTTSMTTLRKAALSVKPPRASFLDFPLGCTAGRPPPARAAARDSRRGPHFGPKGSKRGVGPSAAAFRMERGRQPGLA
jgi:D-proline reductase (dithiol) PrdB